MTDYSYRSNYRPLKDIEQDNNKLQVRNSALSGENSELKYQLDYANQERFSSVFHDPYLS